MGRFNNNYKPEEKQIAEKPSMGMSINSNQLLTPAAIRELATVQAQMVVAKSYPRYMPEVYQKVQTICDSKSLANSATYAYSRGGTGINGPTIRLAEALAKAFGNMKYGFEETDSSNGETKVRAYAFDMETNTLAERTFSVPHTRYTKDRGNQALTDPRDIYEMVANNAQRRVRACILEIIPGDVVDYAMDACMKTRQANIDKSPEKREIMLKAFKNYEVGKADIEAFIQRKFEAIEDSQWLRLQDIYAALKNGMAKKEDFFKAPINPEGRVAGEQVAVVVNVPTSENNPVEAEPQNGPESFDDEEETF